MKKQLLLGSVVMTAMLMTAHHASAQWSSAYDLEGVYNMVATGDMSPGGDAAPPQVSTQVELHAIDDENIQLVGFLSPKVTAHAVFDADEMALYMPYQTICEPPTLLFDRFNAICAGGAWTWDDETFALLPDDDLEFNINTSKKITLANGNAMMLVKDYNVYPYYRYDYITLTYESELPQTGIGQLNTSTVVAECWYTIDGRKVAQPSNRDGQVYIVTQTLQDGSKNSVKVLN